MVSTSRSCTTSLDSIIITTIITFSLRGEAIFIQGHTEQENLITNLRSSETKSNAQYTLIFTALPLAVILPFLRFLFTSSQKSIALACILSITSLLSTAYLMYMIPPDAALFSRGDDHGSLDLSAVVNRRSQRARQQAARGSPSGFFGGPDSPLTVYLPFLNAFVAVLLVVLAGGFRGKVGVPDGLWAFFLLPGLVFAVVLTVRSSIGDVQKGLTELQGMRYGYKGA
ncbi:hypothetical protein LTR84_001769 [Exophiala bonariae]|uniref:Uncharacterized protein n=1 Tax=Exophiala bonariae TaxID=1690606 RepID=A0AAV9NBM0_9EURO|nr:hypothetical protein LTR84_001769 [Exophiala bonariae]